MRDIGDVLHGVSHCSLFGALDGRVTYIIGKDGIVKKIHDNLIDTDSHITVAKKALNIA